MPFTDRMCLPDQRIFHFTLQKSSDQKLNFDRLIDIAFPNRIAHGARGWPCTLPEPSTAPKVDGGMQMIASTSGTVRISIIYHLISVCKQMNPYTVDDCGVHCSVCVREFNFYCRIIKLFGVTSSWHRRPSMCHAYAFNRIQLTANLFTLPHFHHHYYATMCDFECTQSSVHAILWYHMCWKQKCCNKMGLNSDVCIFVLGFSSEKNLPKNNCEWTGWVQETEDVQHSDKYTSNSTSIRTVLTESCVTDSWTALWNVDKMSTQHVRFETACSNFSAILCRLHSLQSLENESQGHFGNSNQEIYQTKNTFIAHMHCGINAFDNNHHNTNSNNNNQDSRRLYPPPPSLYVCAFNTCGRYSSCEVDVS